MFDPFWDPSKNTSFLEAILFWAIFGKMRSTGNQQVHQRAKLIEKHLKNDGFPKKHCNECLICFEIHQKTRIFWKQFFFRVFGAKWALQTNRSTKWQNLSKSTLKTMDIQGNTIMNVWSVLRSIKKNTYFLKAILFWAIWGKMRSTGNQDVYQVAKRFEKHPKKTEIKGNTVIKVWSVLRSIKKHVFFGRNSFLGYFGQHEEHWKPTGPPKSKTYRKAS